MEKIRIGTRSSKLALWQANYIADLLQQGGMETELVAMETKGDKIQNVSLSKIGSKGVFTQELEEMLHSGAIDIAVHSAKDMQSQLPEGLEIIAFTEREVPNDVLVSFDKNINLADPTKDLIIGTSSTRRRAVLRRLYPHITLVESRGNLQTRMKKMEDGLCHGLLLAYAGVHRMEYDRYIAKVLPLDEFTPAVGQGSIAIEAASSLAVEKREKIRALTNHAATEYCLRAERAFLKILQGGCSIPVFGMARLEGGQLSLTGGIVSLDGQEMIRETLTNHTEKAEQLGHGMALKVLELGGDRILAEIKKQINFSGQ
jgi:hydroxymethylbilane synthase